MDPSGKASPIIPINSFDFKDQFYEWPELAEYNAIPTADGASARMNELGDDARDLACEERSRMGGL